MATLTIILAASVAVPAWGQNGSRSWTGNTSTDFYDGSNWSAAGDFPNGNVTFVDSTLTGAKNTTVDRNGNTYAYIWGLYFNNTLGTQSNYTINGSTRLQLSSSTLRTADVTSGSLTDVINCDIEKFNQAETFDIGTNHHLTVNGAVYGTTTTLTKSGAGTLTFAGANTYTGPTTIDEGTLVLDAPSAYYGYAGGQISINNGSTLRVQDTYFFTGKTFVFGSSGGGNLDIGSGNNVFRSDNTFTTLGGSQNTITGTFLNCDGTGTRTFNVADGTDAVDLLMSAQISNNGSVSKTGAGTMTLSGANTYYGVTTVSGGTLNIAGAYTPASVPSGAALTIASGATMNIQSGGSYTFGAANNWQTIDGTLNIETGGSYTENTQHGMQVGANGNSGALNINGGTMTVQSGGGGAAFKVGGDSSGNGAVTISSGTLDVQTTDFRIASGGGSGTVSLDGGTLIAKKIAETSGTSAFNFNGGTLQASATEAAFMTGLDTATVEAGGAIIDTDGNDITIGQALLDGSGGLTKNGTGTLTLSGSSTYSGGTTINVGTMTVSHDSALGAGSVTVDNGDSSSKLVLADGITVSNDITVESNGGGTVKLDTVGSGTATISGLVTVTDGVSRIGNSGAINYDGGLTSASTQLFISDANFNVSPLTLSGELWQHVSDTFFGVTGHTWSKQVIAFGGSTTIGVNDALPTGSGIQFGWGNNAGWNTSTLDLGGYDQEVAYIATVSSGLGLGNAQYITGGGTLTVNQTSTTEFEGVISDGGTATALTKANTGTLTLSGANTYSGATTVNGGVLQAGGADTFSSNSAHNIASGTLRLNGNSVAIGSLAGAGTVESAGWDTLLSDDFSTDYGTDSPPTYVSDPERNFRVYESEIDDGWLRNVHYGAIPAPGQWFITNGRLENADNTAEDANWQAAVPSESQVAQVWSNPGSDSTSRRLTLSFDYNVGSGDTLYAHFWAVTGTSDFDGEFISNMEGTMNGSVDGAGGNSAELTEYNLKDGESSATQIGLVSDAISGALTGSGSFTTTVDIAALGIPGVSTVGDIDYFYIAFAKNEGGTGGSTTWVDNLAVAAGEAILTVGGDNSSTTFLGTIQDGSGGSALALTKSGTGTNTLSGTCTYTGRTTVEAGTLAVAGGTMTTTSVVVNASGTFRVTGDAATIQVAEITSASSGTFEFALDADGVSTVVDTVGCGLANASIDVDGSAYTAGDTTIVLFDSVNLASTSSDVNVSGFDAKYDVDVVQNQDTDEVTLVINDLTPVPSLFMFR